MAPYRRGGGCFNRSVCPYRTIRLRQGISLSFPSATTRPVRAHAGVLHAESPWRTFCPVALAVGVSFIELPCTAGLPILWTNLLATEGVGTAGFIACSPYTSSFTCWTARRVRGTHYGRYKLEERRPYIQLIGGVLMLYLGLTLRTRSDELRCRGRPGLCGGRRLALIVLAASGVKAPDYG